MNALLRPWLKQGSTYMMYLLWCGKFHWLALTDLQGSKEPKSLILRFGIRKEPITSLSGTSIPVSHWGKNQLFIQKFPWFWYFRNVNFVKMRFHNLNFVKNEISKMWTLWKMRFQKGEFCEKWDFRNVNFAEIEISERWIF